jgi:hypothetical protein
MAHFYLLPPRELVGKQLAKLIHGVLPGLRLDPQLCLEMLLNTLESCEQEVYLVHREDLPDQNVEDSLRDGFGARDGDCIVQISPGMIPERPTVRTWTLAAEKTPAQGVAFV